MGMLRAAAIAVRDFFTVEACPPDWDRQAWADRQARLQMDLLAKRREA